MAKATTPKAEKKTTRRRGNQSELYHEFDGLLTMVGKEKIANAISQSLGCTNSEAQTRIRSTIARVGKSNGIVAKRSEPIVTTILNAALELRPAFEDLIENLRTKIQYRNTKTGKRGGSWITALLAGAPRALANGQYQMLMTVDADQAGARCKELNIDLPVYAAEEQQ